MLVTGSHTMTYSGATNSDVSYIHTIFNFDDFISWPYEIKSTSLIILAPFAHVAGKKYPLVQIRVGVQFKKPDFGRITNHLKPVDHAILGSVFFIFFRLEPGQEFNNPPSFVNDGEQIQRIAIPVVKIAGMFANVKAVFFSFFQINNPVKIRATFEHFIKFGRFFLPVGINPISKIAHEFFGKGFF